MENEASRDGTTASQSPYGLAATYELLRESLRARAERLGVAFGDLLNRYEEAEPNWFEIGILRVIRTAVMSLAKYLSDPEDPEITWESPQAEIRFMMTWSPPGSKILPIGTFNVDLDTKHSVDFAKSLPLYLNYFVLAELTNRITLHKRSEGECVAIPPDDLLEKLATLPRTEAQALVDDHARPLVIGGLSVEVDGEHGILLENDPPFLTCEVGVAQDVPPRREAIVELFDHGIPGIQFTGIAGGAPYRGTLVLTISPLEVDDVAQTASFPVRTCLVLHPLQLEGPVEAESEVAISDPTLWSEAERRCLLDSLITDIGVLMHVLQSAPGPEADDVLRLANTVLEAHDTAVVVTVARVAAKKAPAVRDLLEGVVALQEAHVRTTGEIAQLSASSTSVNSESCPRTVDSERQDSRVGPLPGFPLPGRDQFSWEAVTITFTDRESVRISIGDTWRAYNYAELGFRDLRTNGKPNTRWAVLRKLAEVQQIAWETAVDPQIRSRAKKAVGDLREQLKALFSTDLDPFLAYRGVRAYRPRFRLLVERGCDLGEYSPEPVMDEEVD